MRYQGRSTVWKDERGFGFITPNSGNESVFVHVNAFARGARRPTAGDRVTYERVPDDQRCYRVVNVASAEPRCAARPMRRRSKILSSVLAVVLAVLFLLALALSTWQRLAADWGVTYAVAATADAEEGVRDDFGMGAPRTRETFQCEGKRRCTELTSCAEATYYLRNCPGTEIDGDGDGIPCESQ